jgi:hypothetical protein
MASAGDPAVISFKLEPVKRRRRHLGPKGPSVTAIPGPPKTEAGRRTVTLPSGRSGRAGRASGRVP